MSAEATFSHPRVMIEKTQEVFDFFKSAPRKYQGSFADRIMVNHKEENFEPLLSLLEYPQYHLLIAADALRHIAASTINHSNSTTKEPLPILAFHVLARTAIENVALVKWLLDFDSDKVAREKALSIMYRNFRTYEKYAAVRTTLEIDYQQKTDFQRFSDLRMRVQDFARETGLPLRGIPDMTTSEKGIGILETVGGKQLELLYVQLSSVVHGNTWTLGLNAISRKDQSESEVSITSRTYSADSELLNKVLSIATLMMSTALIDYKSLFASASKTS